MSKKDIETEDIREKIERAAFDQFRIKGYAAANMNEIAKLAGTTRSAVYWHFKDKKEMFLVIVQKSIDIVQAKFREVYAQDKSFKECTKDLMLKFSTLNEKEMNVFQLMSNTVLSTAEDSEFKQIYSDVLPIPLKLVGIVLDQIDMAIEKGEITSGNDPEQLAFAILSLVHTVGLKAYDNQVFKSDKELVSVSMGPEVLIDLIFTGLDNI